MARENNIYCLVGAWLGSVSLHFSLFSFFGNPTFPFSTNQPCTPTTGPTGSDGHCRPILPGAGGPTPPGTIRFSQFWILQLLRQNYLLQVLPTLTNLTTPVYSTQNTKARRKRTSQCIYYFTSSHSASKPTQGRIIIAIITILPPVSFPSIEFDSNYYMNLHEPGIL